MTESSRWVVVDDVDSRIKYSGTWEPLGGEDYNDRGNNGETYRNSLHGTATNSSRVWFTFKGNAARIKGTTDFQIDSAGVPDPDWECTLDRKPVKGASAVPVAENNWTFCEFGDIPGGSHTVGLIVKTKERRFWFDYIEYRPTGIVDNEVVRASWNDLDLWYSGSWAPLEEVAHNTMVKGGNATFSFIGTGVTLYGMYPQQLPHADGQGTYSIDGGPSTTFTIRGGGDMTAYNRRIFQVNGLSRQAYTIVVAYASDGGKTPLVISDFFIEGGTNLRAPSSRGSVPAGNAPISPNDGGSSKTPIGAIIGGILGGLAGLLLLLFLMWYWRRRRIQLRHSDDTADQPFSTTREGQRGLVSVPPTSIYTNLPGSPSQVQTPFQHPAARSKRAPAFMPAHSEISYTDPSSPSTPSRGAVYYDSRERFPADSPPLYTVHQGHAS